MAAEPLAVTDVVDVLSQRCRAFKLGESRLRGDIVNVLFVCETVPAALLGAPGKHRRIAHCAVSFVDDAGVTVQVSSFSISQSQPGAPCAISGSFEVIYTFDVPDHVHGTEVVRLAAAGVSAALRNGLLTRAVFFTDGRSVPTPNTAEARAEIRRNYGWFQHPVQVRCWRDQQTGVRRFNLDDIRVR